MLKSDLDPLQPNDVVMGKAHLTRLENDRTLYSGLTGKTVTCKSLSLHYWYVFGKKRQKSRLFFSF